MTSNNRMWLIYTNLLPIALFLVLVPTARASTLWYVNGVNGNDSNNCKTPETACKTIGHAISLAASGDSIVVAAATYTENLTIGISLNVIGSSASTTIIDGNAASRVITILNSSAHVTLSNVTIRNGFAQYGAGILNAGTLTINRSTISGNLAFTESFGAVEGGGISNHGTLIINNSTISRNVARCGTFERVCSFGRGGGIYNGGTLRINNSTLFGNEVSAFAYYGSQGGGISNLGTLTINNSTISANGVFLFRGQGGGISGSATLQNSIVADNKLGGNCSGTMTSKGYNLSSDGTCNFNSPGDLNNHDPLLGPLQNNGGPTPTMALLSGSPAIDGGNPSGCTDDQGQLLKTDQRGQPRPDKEDAGGCDKGAFEGQSD